MESVSLVVLQNVNSAYLVEGILIGFTIGSKDQCCTLNIWKPNHTPALLPSYSLQPSSIITHDSTSSSFLINDHKDFHMTPFLAVNLFTSQVREDNVVSLTSDLFSYLFGPEETLSQSLMIVYGCHCGLVFGYSVKRLPSSNRTSKQKLVSCLDQPVLSIHPLSFSDENSMS